MFGFALLAPSRLSIADVGNVPFFYASGTVFDRQVNTIIIGVNDVIGQAVVSGDRRHVTLNMDTNMYSSPGVQKFAYQKGGMGFVGSGGTPSAPPAAANKLTPTIAALPSEIAPAVSVLDKPGMVLVAPLQK
jgi:hypothetical protein